MKELTDDTPFPWGKHKGTKMKDVPANYLLWLMEQAWIKDWPQIHAYITKNADVLYSEVEEEHREEDDGREDICSSYQDFLDDL